MNACCNFKRQSRCWGHVVKPLWSLMICAIKQHGFIPVVSILREITFCFDAFSNAVQEDREPQMNSEKLIARLLNLHFG